VLFPPFSPPKASARSCWRFIFAAAWALSGGLTLVHGAASPAVPIDSFVRISDDEGLAHSDVRAIAQDHEGFLWFGLRLGGLTRYDGYELKVHQHDPANPRSIGNRVIWCLLVDRRGTVWIGTEGGLDRYDRVTDSFIHYRHDEAQPQSVANNVVTCLHEDSSGRIWVGTRGGLSRLDDLEHGIFTTFHRPQVIEGSSVKDTIRSITDDPSTGLLWLGTTDGLAAFDPRTGAFASYLNDPSDPESLSANPVNKVVRGAGGVFWALTDLGINRFTPSLDHIEHHGVQQPLLRFQRFLQPAEVTSSGNNFFRDGLIDHRGRLWLATRGGLALFDPEGRTFTSYRRRAAVPTSLSDDLTQALFEDRSGNLWIGTFAGGVNRLRSESKPFFIHRNDPNNPQSISEDRIAGLAFDPSGRLWAATVNGLNRFDGIAWKRFLHDPADRDSIPSNDLSTVAAAPNGDVWVGTNYVGPYRFDQHRFYTFPAPTNMPAPNGTYTKTGMQANAILPDAHGGAWIGTRSYGLDYYSEGRFKHYSPQDPTDTQPAQPTAFALPGVLSGEEALWFATESSGLIRLDLRTQKFTTFSPPAENPGTTRSLLCITEGRDGVIWLGAADGLLKFDRKTESFVRQYSTRQGLPNNAIMTIVLDRRGHVWAGTGNGLVDFDPVMEQFRIYEKPDGLPSNVFSQRSGALGPDGRLYFGTRAGIVSFLPEELRDNPNPPPVVVTELRWLGSPPRTPNGVQNSVVLNVGQTIHVAPGQLGFTLKFSALDFTAPEKNRFRYRLEGWDTDWSVASARERSATYTSLPPGDYTFRVQASNADQVWNEQGAAVQISVEPYLWQTLWFRFGLGLALVGSLGAALQWRLRSVRRRNSLLEEQVSQRTAQLQQEVAVRHQAEAALRESHTDLEGRVQARTAELAQANLTLQAEIAERKNVEAQLRQSQKMEAIGQLAGGIAHDFNNLLTVILGQSELLGDTAITPEERDAAVRDINAAAQRATNLTRQLLVFSRHQAVNPVAIDLNQVVAGVSKLLRHVIGEHIVLETQLSPYALGVRVDPGMLEQVLLNMAVNARDVMPRGGQLTIATTRVHVTPEQAEHNPQAKTGDYVCFSVSDTGAGIPDHILPKIFEPFFTTKESGKGTGLGLAISLGIVQQHSGWIDVDTRINRGTTFRVYLPSHPITGRPPAAQGSPLSSTASGATILLAEDEDAVRSVVKHVLTRLGHRVLEASCGADALTCWAEQRDNITLLITDIVMPGWPDGHELAARLAREKPSLRVITMSGYDPSEFAKIAEGNVGRSHLRKPFTAEDLLRAIEATLSKPVGSAT